MSLPSRAIAACLLSGLIGVTATLAPGGFELEERIGLHLLFNLRGERTPPEDVLILALDAASAGKLKLAKRPEKWPRSLHADLTRKLVEGGAAVIAFDLIFDEARSADEDERFAKAIRDAGKVVLAERITHETRPLNARNGVKNGTMTIERLVRPIPVLAESAAATAPFPLPKVPFKVSQYWTFKAGSGDTPTLPVMAFQVFTTEVHDEFVRLLDRVCPYCPQPLTGSSKEPTPAEGARKFAQVLHATFEQTPFLAGSMSRELEATAGGPDRERTHRILAGLIEMYAGPDSHYLNYYGPPGTIPTIPYFHMAEQHGEKTVCPEQVDFEGKAVFVGLSERMRPQQQDGFHTVFSQSNGVDISGVEIAASAFANLLEGMPVRPLCPAAHFATVFLWGWVVGTACMMLSSLAAASAVIIMSALYLMVCQFAFTDSGRWLPLVVPLFIQAPVVLLGTTLWRYSVTQRERKNIQKAFGYFLPKDTVDRLSRNAEDVKGSGQIVYSICLCTDIQEYTSVAERMNPRALSVLMNAYFEAVFEPVREHGGIVSDVKGDSMLAVWFASNPDATLRHQACLAALDIAREVRWFNQGVASQVEESFQGLQLLTRIGLDAGVISLGTVGGGDHYEYRPVGAPVTTADRIEGLNKDLGTQILVSEEALFQLEGFLTRELGEFLLRGKKRPVVVHELICRRERSNETQRMLCEVFAEGLNAYRRRCWDEASDMFAKASSIESRDGPSLFYSRLCDAHKENPPGEEWDGLIRMHDK